MWIVRLALRRPYTFVVAAILILLFGVLAILRTPTDIFPNINIPVVSIIWTYNGLVPREMNDRIVYVTERALTTTVGNIEHIESQSLYGVAVVKVFFQPTANVERGIAQITAVSQTQLRQLPPGTTPPLILAYSASSVPVLQLALSGQGLSEQQLNDYGLNFIRTRLITVPGASVPYPYGGKQRQVQVDLNPDALQSKGLSALDVVNAITLQNLILPTGTSKIGGKEYDVDVPNAAPQTMEELNRIPIKTIADTTIYMKDVAWVRDGFPPQANIVRVNGQRSVLLTIQKAGDASTLRVIAGIKSLLPQIATTVPTQLKMDPLADQSVLVLGAISGVVREALIAACLTAFMILVFLGNWRSTLIIGTSIPLAILTSLIVLSAIGETINIMTLGGLALAVGILVDDATVEVENINRNRELAPDRDLDEVVLLSASQIATPAFVSTLSICIVFAPIFRLSGVARYLFLPLAEAVVFAMLASYLLSRTIVPTMAKYLLRHERVKEKRETSRNPLVGLQRRFESAFERFRQRYRGLLDRCLHHSRAFLSVFFAACLGSLAMLVPWLGQDFFPSVDAGSFKLHVRGPTGMRIEDTAFLCDLVENAIRQEIPGAEVQSIIDNIGLPVSGINLSYSNSAPIGTADADILVQLSRQHHPTDSYIRDLRVKLARQFPGVMFAFLPSDMVTQILNFGLPASIDIQVGGYNLEGNRAWASELLEKIRYVPGTADLRIQQPFDQPYLHMRIERTKAQELGFSAHDIAQNLLVSLSGSFQTSPTFWVNPKTGVSYQIATQTPQYRADKLQELLNIPVTGTDPNAPPSLMASLVSIQRGSDMAVESHYDIAPVIDIFGSVSGRDLGGVSRDINRLIDAARTKLPRGSQVVVRGQVQTMRTSYVGLLSGLIFAILLDYLLIVVNFQSWLDPFIMISALPAALSGIAWFLFITHTTLSVPALMGTIMCMGVATANSILVVSFATEQMVEGKDPLAAALEAGFTRFRPVLMTALAMIIGMVPMALGLGDGGGQNAPLGRAVIGGLLFATVSTLFFVPTFFSLLHERRGRISSLQQQKLELATRVPDMPQIETPDEKVAPDAGALNPQREKTRPRTGLLGPLIVALVFAGLLVSGIRSRERDEAKLRSATDQMAVPSVSVVIPKRAASTQEIILPGNLQPFISSPIYARTDGYLKKWYFDIGAHVKAGQLLAVIQTPEVDQQLAQARATLATAQANLQLAAITLNRYEALLTKHAVSQQDVDNAVGTYNANKAIVQADEASVQRYEALVSFEKLYAPFDGVITARNTDIGDLVNSGSSSAPKTDLFHISQTSILRVYVNVPEEYSQRVKPSETSADIVLAEFPGQKFRGRLVRTADAINMTTRTLLVEIDVANPTDTLLSGSYAEVHLKIPSNIPTYQVPVNTLIFRSSSLQVGVVKDGKVTITDVMPGHDLGQEIEIVAGLKADDQVVMNPPDSLVTGQAVQIVHAMLPGDNE